MEGPAGNSEQAAVPGKPVGAALVIVCPFCDIMYELQQRRIERLYETRYNLPVVFYPQLLGLAMGLSGEEVGLPLNRVKSKKLAEIAAAGQIPPAF